MRRLLLVPVLLVVLGAAGCTATGPQPVPSSASPTPSAAAVRFATLAVARPLTIAAASAPERALSASRALFAAAPGVVVARDGDGVGQRAAAAVAERLHVPLLLVAAARSATASPTASPSRTAGAGLDRSVEAEIRRLGAAWVAGDAPVLRDVSAAGVRHVALGAAPAVQVPAPRASTAVAADASADTAALATARAAGATVVEAPHGVRLPNASAAVVTALRKARNAPAVLVGRAFAGLDTAWSVAAARTGYQYPGGGQVPFEHRLLVALYGAPGSPALGVLGQQGPQATVDRVEALVRQYRPLVHEPVGPLLEVIATVASGSPTDDGDYSSELPDSALNPYVDAAAKAGIPVVLDLQPGRSDFLTQARHYRSLLSRPNVGLALDPEWRLGPKQRPLVQIGRVSADEVNRTSAWLAGLVRQEGLPPKPFVLHEFRLTMLQDRSRIVVDRPELDVLIHVDGQGSQPDKQATWRAVRASAPRVAWGWKNFLKKDHPVLTPRQTIAQVHPTPDLITYQ